MDDKVPYIVFEGELTRMERTTKRLWITILLLIILLVGSNGAWLYYESQFDDVTTTVTQELKSDNGSDAIINDGVHINGKSETNSDN